MVLSSMLSLIPLGFEGSKMGRLFLITMGLFLICFSETLVKAEYYKYKDPKQPLHVRINDLLGRMTLQEKIGQMAQIERVNATPMVMKNYFIGSVLSGGGSAPSKKASAKAWVNMVNKIQKGALSTRLGIPMIYGIDAVHGHNNVYNATIFPHNIGLGATRDPQLVKKIGVATALEVRATGIPYAFSPCVAVCRDPRWGRCYESYGEDPKIVRAMTEMVSGLQGEIPPQSRKGVPYVAGKQNVAACAKHFVGDGGTTKGINENNTIIDRHGLLSIHMPGYYDAISKGVATIMVSYSSWNGVKMHANKNLITDFLKNTLHFEGFVISDWQGIDKITTPPHANYTYSILASVTAGVDMVSYTSNTYELYDNNTHDLTTYLGINSSYEFSWHPNVVGLGNMSRNISRGARKLTWTVTDIKKNNAHDLHLLNQIMVPYNYTEFINGLTYLVKNNAIPMSRIDDAVKRILRVKFVMGLFENPIADLSLVNELGKKEHRELAREAVRKSLVLLKNGKSANKPLLPLPKKAPRILVAGSHANNLGNQCGGWTMEWQGLSGNNLTSGTTVLGAIKDTIDPKTKVIFKENPDTKFVKSHKFSYAIVVVGEHPYAETNGDSLNLTMPEPGPSIIRNVCGAVKCVVIVISGRPVVMQPYIGSVDALVAAWLPGTEGKGISDVLFGDYGFTGKLSQTWFKTVDQLPMNFGDSHYDPLFPFGFGLTTNPINTIKAS